MLPVRIEVVACEQSPTWPPRRCTGSGPADRFYSRARVSGERLRAVKPPGRSSARRRPQVLLEIDRRVRHLDVPLLGVGRKRGVDDHLAYDAVGVGGRIELVTVRPRNRHDILVRAPARAELPYDVRGIVRCRRRRRLGLRPRSRRGRQESGLRPAREPPTLARSAWNTNAAGKTAREPPVSRNRSRDG